MLRKIKIKWIGILICILASYSCSNYLDLVPDNIQTLDNAFEMRSEAQRYLYTCYSYLPRHGDVTIDPSILGGDELWSIIDSRTPIYSDQLFRIARGFQNATTPLGGFHWTNAYQAIRTCNIFLENISAVPDLPAWELEQWIAEATFLKAYYHFYIVRMYGPVPIIRENLPVSASPEQVKVSRDPVDECFDYIVELLDQAIPGLPLKIINPNAELGRITRPIAAAFKAKVMVTAASPLFNGNTDQFTLKNKDGRQLFSEADNTKWDSAVVACKEAIDICHEAEIELFKYETRSELNDTVIQELTIRNTFTEKWNSEIIWANTQTSSAASHFIQEQSTANLDAANYPDNAFIMSQLQPPIKIAEMYYTNHGVPMDDDKDWQSLDRSELREGSTAERYYIKKGYTTIQLHFNREPRFYACLGFDGGIWYGQRIYGNNPEEYFYIACRIGGAQAKKGSQWGPFTGYYWKKSVHFQNVQTSTNDYSTIYYPWTIMRLSDLYLLYAEALNEAEGPNGANSAELFKYIDSVRAKNGLEGVKASWSKYAIATSANKYNDKIGMRSIIHRERLIELSLEGQRFWDLRRWKEAPAEYAKGIEGYKVTESAPAKFYQRIVLAKQTFSIKDYFWPIETALTEQNTNLVQNIGW